MSKLFCCECKNICTGIAITVSIIIGVIALILGITGALTLTTPFLLVAVGVAIVYLAVLLLTASTLRSDYLRRCICMILPVVLVAILGTILLSAILLAFTFAATSIIGAIITGALVGFFALIITSTACLVNCISGCNEE